jgi:hypothetical protein
MAGKAAVLHLAEVVSLVESVVELVHNKSLPYWICKEVCCQKTAFCYRSLLCCLGREMKEKAMNILHGMFVDTSKLGCEAMLYFSLLLLQVW